MDLRPFVDLILGGSPELDGSEDPQHAGHELLRSLKEATTTNRVKPGSAKRVEPSVEPVLGSSPHKGEEGPSSGRFEVLN